MQVKKILLSSSSLFVVVRCRVKDCWKERKKDWWGLVGGMLE